MHALCSDHTQDVLHQLLACTGHLALSASLPLSSLLWESPCGTQAVIVTSWDRQGKMQRNHGCTEAARMIPSKTWARLVFLDSQMLSLPNKLSFSLLLGKALQISLGVN